MERRNQSRDHALRSIINATKARKKSTNTAEQPRNVGHLPRWKAAKAVHHEPEPRPIRDHDGPRQLSHTKRIGNNHYRLFPFLDQAREPWEQVGGNPIDQNFWQRHSRFPSRGRNRHPQGSRR